MADLPGIMANLELKDQFEASSSQTCATPPRIEPSEPRILRKRLGSSYFPKDATPMKRRCSLAPKKNINNPDVSDLESYYRNNDKFKPPTLKSLETIYEEPLVKKNGAVLLVGANKQRRILFNGRATKDKLKKRKTKIKKSFAGKGGGSVKKSKRLSMDAFLKRLHGVISSDCDANNPDALSELISASCKLAPST